VETDLDKGKGRDQVVVINKDQAVEINKDQAVEIKHHSSDSKKPSPLLRKSKIRSNRRWPDSRDQNLEEERPSQEGISVPKEIAIQKWKARRLKYSR
jgi:hypothetical protein